MVISHSANYQRQSTILHHRKLHHPEAQDDAMLHRLLVDSSDVAIKPVELKLVREKGEPSTFIYISFSFEACIPTSTFRRVLMAQRA